VEQRIRLAHPVYIGAPNHHEAYTLVKADRLPILFVNIKFGCVEVFKRILDQRPAKPLRSIRRMNEQHLDLSVQHTNEANSAVALPTNTPQRNRRQCMVPDDGLEELDVSFPNEMVRCPNRCFPYREQIIKLIGSNFIYAFFITHRIAQWSLLLHIGR
jgi:hypothetical protein